MSYLVGKIALDIDAGAPNNGRGENNVGQVKRLWIGRDCHPYVSAQAFRRWLRDSLPADEQRSPVTRSGSGRNQQAYTDGRPDLFLDDDVFGYMVANRGENYQRDTVLATGTLVSVVPRRPTTDFGTMSRNFGAGENPVIHEHEHYSAELAADVLLDLPRIGTLELAGSGLRRNLTDAAAQQATEAGAEQIDFRGVASLRLPLAERRRRAALIVRTLAKKALHYGDRSPALVVLAPVKGGNNPFTRILAGRRSQLDERHTETVFDPDILREELTAWADELDGPVVIGWAPGFLGDQRDRVRKELDDLIAADQVVIDHPRVVLRALADRIQAGDHDEWFEDR